MATPVALRGVIDFAAAPVEIDRAITDRLAEANASAAVAAERVYAGERLQRNRKTYSERWHVESDRLIGEYRTKSAVVFADRDDGPVPEFPFMLRDELATLDAEITTFDDFELPRRRNQATIAQCIAMDCRAFVYEALADQIEQRATVLLAPAAILQGDSVDLGNTNTTSARLCRFGADLTLAATALRSIVAERERALALGAKDPGVFNASLLAEWDQAFAVQFNTRE